MIFDPKKGGSFSSTFLTPRHPPTPPPPPPPSKPQKSGFQVAGSGRVRPKTHWGMRLLDKIMILPVVKLTIQPLAVGYADRPKKAKMGRYVAFSPIYACLTLI